MQEKHIEGLIEKFTLRLEQCASGAGDTEATQQDEGLATCTAKVEERHLKGNRRVLARD